MTRDPATIDLAACSPGPAMNANLRRIYTLYPSIGAWARAGRPGPLWPTSREAFGHLQRYIGPVIDDLIIASFHLTPDDVEFLGSAEVFNAIVCVVQQIYGPSSSLVDGLFPQEGPRAA